MGYLAAAGAYLIIGLVVSFILMVVGLFIGQIFVFDRIALGIISGVLVSSGCFALSRQEIRHKTRVASGTLRAENACVSAASRARKRHGRYFILKPQKIPL